MDYDLKTKEDRMRNFVSESLSTLEVIFYSFVFAYFSVHLLVYIFN